MDADYSIPPLRELPSVRLHQRQAHLLAEIAREQQPRPRAARLASPRLRLTMVAAAVTLAVVGSAVAAARHWLLGEPAPPAVVSNFESYAPQLGFHPLPGRAVFVAADGDIRLFATTNAEGTYCVVVDTPWKPATANDGGVCVPEAQASAPIVAGFVGGSAVHDETWTLVIAGRVDDATARTVRFTDPAGNVIERPVGWRGFFVAAVRLHGSACAGGHWIPTFSAAGASGDERVRATIQLAYAHGRGVCGYPSLHS